MNILKYLAILRDTENRFKIQSLQINFLIWYNYWKLKSKTYVDDRA